MQHFNQKTTDTGKKVEVSYSEYPWRWMESELADSDKGVWVLQSHIGLVPNEKSFGSQPWWSCDWELPGCRSSRNGVCTLWAGEKFMNAKFELRGGNLDWPWSPLSFYAFRRKSCSIGVYGQPLNEFCTLTIHHENLKDHSGMDKIPSETVIHSDSVVLKTLHHPLYVSYVFFEG